MDTVHPDDLQLEEARTGEAEAWITTHLAGCDQCRRRVAWLGDLAGTLEPTWSMEVPETWDRAIEALAHRRARVVRAHHRMRRAAKWVLPVAAGLVAVLLWLRSPDNGRGDTNADGVVDIVDALLLARQIEQGLPPDMRLDVNGDRLVDRQDVECIARAAVSLEGGKR